MAVPLNVVASGAITTNGQTVAMTAFLLATGTVQVSGTWTGTLVFEATVDGTMWGALAMTPLAGGASVTGATASGAWAANIEALIAIRVRATAAMTGSATLALAGSSQLYTALVAPGGLNPGSIVFANASGVLAQDSGFTYDSVNHIANATRVGVNGGNAGHWLNINNVIGVGSGINLNSTADNTAAANPTPMLMASISQQHTTAGSANYNNVYSLGTIGAQGGSPVAAQGSVAAFTAKISILNALAPTSGVSEPALYVGFLADQINDATVSNGAGRYQLIQLTNTPTGGTWTLAGNSATTPAMAFNAAASVVQINVRALGGAYAAANVFASANLPFACWIDLGASGAALVGDGTALTGAGTQPAVTQAANFGGTYGQSPWLMDLNLQGQIGVQPETLTGISVFQNNHYNGSPSRALGGAFTASTGRANGGGSTTSLFLADTYPMDYGFAAQGTSQAAGVTGQGYRYGAVIGSSIVSPGVWNIAASMIGVGLAISDTVTAGIEFGAPHSSAPNSPSIVFDAGAKGLGSTMPVAVNNAYDLGSGTLRFRDGYFAGSINFANAGVINARDTIGNNITLLTLAADNTVRFGTTNAPTTNGHVILQAAGVEAMRLLPTSVNTQLAGSLVWGADNTKDIGASGATRPRDLYLGRNAIVSGALASGQSATAPDPTTGGTIATANVGVARVAPAGAETGMILAVGTIAGQEVTVINEAVAANSITFAAQATSHVSNGVSTVIAGLTAQQFVWDTGTSLWYPA